MTDVKYPFPNSDPNIAADKTVETMSNALKAIQIYSYGILKYLNEFMAPYWIALNSFNTLEKEKLKTGDPLQALSDYLNIFKFNLQVAEKGFNGTFSMMNTYHVRKAEEAFLAFLNTVFDKKGEDVSGFIARYAKLLQKVVYEYPQAILAAKADYGFHFEDETAYVKFAETERFELWQVLPTDGFWVRISLRFCRKKRKAMFMRLPTWVFRPISVLSRILM